MLKNVGIFITEYSLLLFLLIHKKWDQVTFIFQGRIRTEVIRRLKECGIRSVFGEKTTEYGGRITKKQQILKRVVYKILRVILLFRVYIFFRRFDKKSVRVYGQDHAEAAFLFRSYDFTVVEDGVGNYFPREVAERGYKLIYGISSDESLSYMPFGRNDSVSRIYLTGKAPIPEDIKEKSIVFDIRVLWNEKTEEEKRKICYVFGFDLDYVLDVVQNGRDIFLLTQNYAPIFCTEDEQISIYKKLLSNYDLSRVVIKPHPADHIAYERYFRDCLIMKESFPFELVYLTQIPIRKIIGINSTSLYGLWDSSYIEMHEEILEELRKKGNI